MSSLAIDSHKNIIAVSQNWIKKYQSDGTEITSSSWPINIGYIDDDRFLAIDSLDNYYVTGYDTTRKYKSDGTEITTGWPKNNVIGNCIAIDSNDDIYIGNRGSSGSSTSNGIIEIQSDGTELWSDISTYDDAKSCVAFFK